MITQHYSLVPERKKRKHANTFFSVLARDNRAYAGKPVALLPSPLVISNGALRDYEVRDCCRVVRNRHMNRSQLCCNGALGRKTMAPRHHACVAQCKTATFEMTK